MRIFRQSQKGNSANFACREFSGVHPSTYPSNIHSLEARKCRELASDGTRKAEIS